MSEVSCHRIAVGSNVLVAGHPLGIYCWTVFVTQN